MTSLIVVNFISLDGVIQAPLRADEDEDGGFRHGGWVQPYLDETVATYISSITAAAAGMLLGRRTYENFVADWEQAEAADPAIAAMNRMPKYLVSRTLADPTWNNTTRLGPDLTGEVDRLRSGATGEIVIFGSGQVVRELQRHDQIDGYRLLTFPVLLGGGKRMFDDTRALIPFELDQCTVSQSGVIMAGYRRRVRQ